MFKTATIALGLIVAPVVAQAFTPMQQKGIINACSAAYPYAEKYGDQTEPNLRQWLRKFGLDLSDQKTDELWDMWRSNVIGSKFLIDESKHFGLKDKRIEPMMQVNELCKVIYNSGLR